MSLLWMTDNERVVKVNDDIFSNLNLDKLLDYKTLGILSCYCNDDELSGRIFTHTQCFSKTLTKMGSSLYV